jgi:SAM-dependent methyltransferase
MFDRARSVLHYLSFGESVWKWRLRRLNGGCPRCGGKNFLLLGRISFLTRCLRCSANLTNVSVIEAIKRTYAGTVEEADAYELSSYGATLEWLRAHARSITFSEYMPEHPFGQQVCGIRNEDVQQLTFRDECFDLVTCNQVFEHVADDLAGFRELARVLKPGGATYMTVPLHDIPQTRCLAELRPDGSLQWHGDPEYHDSRHGGPRSAPVFWLHSRHDICDRVRSSGFRSVNLIEVTLFDEVLPESVIVARR